MEKQNNERDLLKQQVQYDYKEIKLLRNTILEQQNLINELVEGFKELFTTADSMIESKGIDTFKGSLMFDYVHAHNKAKQFLDKSSKKGN